MPPRIRLPRCWSCSEPVSPGAVQGAAILQPREAEHGGPYEWYECFSCSAKNGILASSAAGWLLYPLEGRYDSKGGDWALTATERARRRRAKRWWSQNASIVDNFRRGRREGAGEPQPAGARARSAAPPPPPRATRAERAAPHTGGKSAAPPPPRQERPAERPPAHRPALDGDPRTLLGVGPDATVVEIRRAYREAVKRSHPDRVAHMDRSFQELAHARMKALRRAYESLLARA